jgi:Uma2 family endonuclease
VSTARQYAPHYTVDDYVQWEGDWELWGGIAIAMSPSPFGRHQAIVRNILVQLCQELKRVKCTAEAVHEMDWIVSRDTVVRPDLVVICGPIPDRHLESLPALVVEVFSDTTRDRDRTYKKQLYDEQGVNAYLMVDPETESIEVLTRVPLNTLHPKSHADAIELTICNDCQIKLHPADIFRR